MKVSTSFSLESGLAAQVRSAADARGESASVYAERALRNELMREAATAAAAWEHARGMDTAEYAELLHADQVASLTAAYGPESAR